MGRTEKSQGLAPPSIRKDVRAKQSRHHIINKTIPAILLSNSRARQGVESSLLIVNPDANPIHNNQPEEDETRYIQRKGQGRRKLKHNDQTSIASEYSPGSSRHASRNEVGFEANAMSPPKDINLRVICTNTLAAAALMNFSSNKKRPNVCILNMASPLRPGGGVLNGATSQEEFLCARTTLLPSLKESFYRLPEIGGVFTHDVLVFRNSRPLDDPLGEIPVAERFWVDVISAGMLRFPQLQEENDGNKRWNNKDRISVEAKMRAVLRIASYRGVKKLVLGAWGCGAYGNPVSEVAQAWKKILVQRKNDHTEKDIWSSIEEVVFAITDRAMADEFASVFDKDVEIDSSMDSDDREEVEKREEIARELQEKIQQLQEQISRAQNAELKSRLKLILDDLIIQSKEQETEHKSTKDQTEEVTEIGD